ncbi:hypothetical protein ZWY2020_019700 [Hordeum vulgare]|nr:hypothetical protein ZWY2020_019700 [Hordeum vulgare]
MASVTSCSSTVFTSSSSSIPYRTRTPRPSLRPPPRLAGLPGDRYSSTPEPHVVIPKRRKEIDSSRRTEHLTRNRLRSMQVLRCPAKRDLGEPPLLLELLRFLTREAPEPAVRDRGGLAPFEASRGLAFAAAAGALMIQGSQQALAGTQFMGPQPPADVLGISGHQYRFCFIISVVLGRAFHYVDGFYVQISIDDILAVCLLVYYGVTTLLDAASGDGEKMNEEQEEAEIAVSKFSGNGAGLVSVASTLASTFVLVFVAEWGDKSFFSTIALAAASSPPGVIAGSLAGHGVATLIAVLGGSLLGTFLSEKIIAYIGGSLFLAFAAVTLVEIATS